MKKIILTGVAMFTILIAAFSQNVGIGTATPANKLDVTGAAPSSINATIYATNTGNYGNGILAESNGINTVGLRGTSTTGTGVLGKTLVGTAMVGTSLSGTAVYGQSSTGYGLISSGKLKISGGNTNPTAGALLVSDANGNATWQRSGLAFSANTPVNSIPGGSNGIAKVEFSNQVFDTQNNFTTYTGTVTSGSSVFTAPVAGIYHFSSAILFEKTGVEQYSTDILNGTISLMQNGVIVVNSNSASVTHPNGSGGYSCFVYLSVDADVHLNANDKIWIEAGNIQNANTTTPIPLNASPMNSRFSGELIFAD